MNKIQQYLRDREVKLRDRLYNFSYFDSDEFGLKEVDAFNSETIKRLLRMLVEEYDKLPVEWVIKSSSGVKGIIDGRATPFISKQETINRLLEINR